MVTTQNTKIIFRLFISTTKDNIDDDNIVPFLTIGNGDDVANVQLSELKEVFGQTFWRKSSNAITVCPPPEGSARRNVGRAFFVAFAGPDAAARNTAGIYIIII